MPGMPIEETIAFLKIIEPYADIVQIRADTCMNSHPTGFNSIRGDYQTIHYARAMKKAGIKTPLEVVGGYHNPVDMEKFLADGDCDLISMGRSWICNPEIPGKKFNRAIQRILFLAFVAINAMYKTKPAPGSTSVPSIPFMDSAPE